jgi:hypothetical protein
LLVACIAAAIVVFAGCGGDDDADTEPASVTPPEERTAEGNPPTESELVGLWAIEETEPTRLITFEADGSFAIDDRGQLDDAPAAAGSYELEGQEITFNTEGSDICVDGDTWVFEVGVPESGRLHMVIREDAEEPCNQGVGAQWFLVEEDD